MKLKQSLFTAIVILIVVAILYVWAKAASIDVSIKVQSTFNTEYWIEIVDDSTVNIKTFDTIYYEVPMSNIEQVLIEDNL